MLKGLARLIQDFTPPSDEIGNRLRDAELESVRRYCERQGLGFYPEEVKRLPVFAREVNRFIENRARNDLPQEQFEDRLSTDDFSKWVETGGIIGYNGSLFELCYCPPDTGNIRKMIRLQTSPDAFVPKNVWVEMYGGNPADAFTIHSTTSMKSVKPEDLEKAKYVIDWHTHPVGLGDVSNGDVDHMQSVFEILGDAKPIYFVVFRPAKNQCVWYRAKKAQPSR